MKGISPVIATVLLLLMAVAAVGGAWVWYQRMQGSAQLGGGAAISNIQETAILQGVYINRAYADSVDTDMLALYVGNQGSGTVQLDKIEVNDGSGYDPCNTSTVTITTQGFGTVLCDDLVDDHWNYTTGTSLKIKLFASGMAIETVVTAE